MDFSIVNLGCKVNRIESDTIEAELQSYGTCVSSHADVVVVNTCTVTSDAEKKARKATRRALRDNPQARIFVTGCAASINPDEFTRIDPRVSVVAKPRVVDSVLSLQNDTSQANKKPDATLANDVEPCTSDRMLHRSMVRQELAYANKRTNASYRTRVGIKVQDGCNNACSYCIVHVARGKATSRNVESCVAEARELGKAHVKEAVLSGIDIGNYHRPFSDCSQTMRDALLKYSSDQKFPEISALADDLKRADVNTHHDDIDLCDLLFFMRQAAPSMRLRISSCEPAGITDRLLRFMEASDGMVCRHLHIPLQSGSTRILQKMNRPYSAHEYLSLIQHVRACIPSISISTDIIVGFPGETDEDFQQTLQMARACQFSKIHVFRYSRREGTPADVMSDQVPAEIKAQRAHELGKLAWILRLRDAKHRVGQTERIVVMPGGVGMSESYHDVYVGDDLIPGQMVERKLSGVSREGIFTL